MSYPLTGITGLTSGAPLLQAPGLPMASPMAGRMTPSFVGIALPGMPGGQTDQMCFSDDWMEEQQMSSCGMLGMSSLFGAGDPMQAMLGMQGQMMAMMQQLLTILAQVMSGGTLGSLAPGADGLGPFGGPSTAGGGGHASSAAGGSHASGGRPAGATGPATDPSTLSSGPLASAITKDALANTTNVGGLCLKNVGAVLRRHGIACGPAPAAHMVDDDLARSSKMREIHVSKDQLKNLPAGAVIVWEKGSGLPYGHISLSLGDGREWSGPIRQQMQLGTSYRVFVPKE